MSHSQISHQLRLYGSCPERLGRLMLRLLGSYIYKDLDSVPLNRELCTHCMHTAWMILIIVKHIFANTDLF